MGALEQGEGKLPLFAGIDGVRFRRVVRPGDQLRIEVEVLKVRRAQARSGAGSWWKMKRRWRGSYCFSSPSPGNDWLDQGVKQMKIMLIAGDAAGDASGAELAKAVLQAAPQARLFGMGEP